MHDYRSFLCMFVRGLAFIVNMCYFATKMPCKSMYSIQLYTPPPLPEAAEFKTTNSIWNVLYPVGCLIAGFEDLQLAPHASNANSQEQRQQRQRQKQQGEFFCPEIDCPTSCRYISQIDGCEQCDCNSVKDRAPVAAPQTMQNRECPELSFCPITCSIVEGDKGCPACSCPSTSNPPNPVISGILA